MKVELAYGHKKIEFEVEDQRLLQIAEPCEIEPIKEVKTALAKEIENPYGPKLEEIISRGDRVLFLTVDHTRPSPKDILWPVVEKVKKLGANKTDIIIALGNHRKMTDRELESHIGSADVFQHDSKGKTDFLGESRWGTPIEVSPLLKEYDKHIAVGFVEPSYLAGFSGGRKMIMPGLSSSRSIAKNHFLLLRQGIKQGKLEGNEISEDALEIALKVGVDWIVNVAVNPNDSYAGIYCGDLIKAHKKACQKSLEINSCRVKERADIVITSPGGYPYDMDLVQGKKGVVPAIDMVKEGGVIILLAECEEGWAAEATYKHLLLHSSPREILGNMYAHLKSSDQPWEWAPCTTAFLFSHIIEEKKVDLIIISALKELEQTFVETASSLKEAMEKAEKKMGKRSKIGIIRDARRVIIL